jgi:hypothetical protein
MPFFAIAHMYAFSYKDFIDPKLSFVARMPMYYAFWDAFGIKDVVEDSKATLKGKGMDYREFEPAEGHIHQGIGRNRRIKAGLRYSKGGKRKYWLPKFTNDADRPDLLKKAVNRVAGGSQDDEQHAPLLADAAENVIHTAPDIEAQEEIGEWDNPNAEGGLELPFGDLDDADEALFEHSKKYLFGDYNYPCIDVSSEFARVTMWDEEERVLRDERGAWFSPLRGAKGRLALDQRETPAWEGYGAVGTHPRYTEEIKGKGRNDDDRMEGNGRAGREREIIIDFEQDRTPPMDINDVLLKWTKKNARGSQSSSQRQSPHPRDIDRRPSAEVVNTTPGHSGSPQRINVQSRPATRSRTHSRPQAASALPPDAVDLVVEDEHAAVEDRARERRKGEPAVRGSAYRKVYRREAIASDGDAEVDVLKEETNDGGRVAAVGIHAISDEGEGPQGERGGSDAPERWRDDTLLRTDKIVTQAEMPPVQARAVLDRYVVLDEHEANPWA